MTELDKHLQQEILIAQAVYESSTNANCRPCPCYFVWDMVWLNAKNIGTARPALKLDDRNIGSYQVAWVFFNNLLIMQLELPESVHIHLIFHVNLLQHATDNPLPRQ